MKIQVLLMKLYPDANNISILVIALDYYYYLFFIFYLFSFSLYSCYITIFYLLFSPFYLIKLSSILKDKRHLNTITHFLCILYCIIII